MDKFSNYMLIGYDKIRMHFTSNDASTLMKIIYAYLLFHMPFTTYALSLYLT